MLIIIYGLFSQKGNVEFPILKWSLRPVGILILYSDIDQTNSVWKTPPSFFKFIFFYSIQILEVHTIVISIFKKYLKNSVLGLSHFLSSPNGLFIRYGDCFYVGTIRILKTNNILYQRKPTYVPANSLGYNVDLIWACQCFF